MTTSEVDALDPDTKAEVEGGPITLSNGVKVDINRLKTRETLKLLKIITKGAGYALGAIDLSGDTEDATQSLLIAVLMAVPEAEEETIDFVRALVAPAELISNPKSKAEKEINNDIIAKLVEATDNPELEDLVDIITAVVKAEAPHIQALGKRLGLLLKTYRPEQS
jgi:hypothetical protein